MTWVLKKGIRDFESISVENLTEAKIQSIFLCNSETLVYNNKLTRRVPTVYMDFFFDVDVN